MDNKYLDLVVFIAAVSTLLGCTTEPWPVPSGTPPQIAEMCREQAALASGPATVDTLDSMRVDSAGSGDDILEDAMAADRKEEQQIQSAETIFKQCLESHGIASGSSRN